MNVFKRAVLYLTRKRIRSILVFLLLFFMGLFMQTGLSIHSGADRAAEEMRKSISSGLEIKMIEVSGEEIYALSYNEDGELVRTLKHPLITESVAENLSSLPGVSGYYSEMGTELLYTGLNVVPGSYTEQLRTLEENGTTADSERIACSSAWSKANGFFVVQESEYYPYFRNGAFELIAGRHLHIEDTGKILISEEFAARNGLDIGDAIDGQNFDPVTGEFYGEMYHAEIAGIFRINFEQQLSEWTAEPHILANTIFAPFELRHWGQVQYNTFYGRDILAKEDDRLLGSVTLFVEDPAELDMIKEQIQENQLVDWNYYTIQRYDSDYRAAAKPLLSMTLFASCMVAVVIIGTLLILSLVLAMWMRSRKHEIDILICLGTGKRMILTQFLIEMSIVAALAFLTSRLVAVPVTRVIGDMMTEITNPAEGSDSFSTTYEPTTGITHISRTPVRQKKLSYQISYGASAGTFLAMIAVALGTVVFVFQRMQNTSLLSRKGPDVRHWNFQKVSKKGAMKAHHRAWLYVTRKTGKSMLLLFTLFVIMSLFLFGISIRLASEHAAAQLRESFSGYFKLIPDYQRNDAVNQVNQELVNYISKFDEIEASNAMDVCYMDVQNISLIPGKFSTENDEKADMTRILGNMNSSLHEYFSLEIFELAEGVHIEETDTGKALISSELAQRNQLKVGDHFTLITSAEDRKNGVPEKMYELEIAGLFSEKQQTSMVASQTPECDMAVNFIFTDIFTTQQIRQDMQHGDERVYSGGTVFYVKDPEKVEDVILIIEEAGIVDEDYTRITVNNASYQNSMEPLSRLSSMSLMMLVIIVGIGVILLTLILTLWERDRIHEAGILMSFGILKRNIWWQRFVECVSIFVVAFIISIIVFSPVSEKMGDWIYERASAAAEQSAGTESKDSMEIICTESIETDAVFRMELSPAIILFSGLGGLVLVEGAVSMAFFFSSHNKPKELLIRME